MEPTDVITNLIKLHADYTCLSRRYGYTINQEYSKAIAKAASHFEQPQKINQNTQCFIHAAVKELKNLKDIYNTKANHFKPGTPLYLFWKGKEETMSECISLIEKSQNK